MFHDYFDLFSTVFLLVLKLFVNLHLKLIQDLYLILTQLESRIMAQLLGCLPVLSSLGLLPVECLKR